MSDPFFAFSDSIVAPARSAFAIIPDDSEELSTFTKAIYVGNGGDVTLRTIGSDSDVLFTNVQDGSFLDVRCSAIRASGTTASGIVGLA